MRRLLLIFVCLAVAVPIVFGMRGSRSARRPLMLFFDMDFQPRYRAQGESDFFADGKSQRDPIPGTIPFGGADYFADAGTPRQDPDFLAEDDVFYRGKQDESWVADAPRTMTRESILEGQKNYQSYCIVCHGGTGAGNGIMSQYGLTAIASLVDQRVIDMPDGQIYHTIGNGKGLMQGYGHQIKPTERWNIVHYVRALQRSRSATIEDVPEPFRSELINNE